MVEMIRRLGEAEVQSDVDRPERKDRRDEDGGVAIKNHDGQEWEEPEHGQDGRDERPRNFFEGVPGS